MNYYKRHLGDYAKDAGHLSLLEHGVYSMLLDAYYGREKPLPVDLRECCKLVRAATKVERDAAAYVLREFFDLQSDGWHQSRADRELDAAAAQAAVNQRIATEREARKRSTRNQRNVERNEHEAFSTPEHEACENREPSHKPLAISHKPERSESSPQPESPSSLDTHRERATAAGSVSKAMRQAGLTDTNPANPTFVALLATGATEAEFIHAARKAADAGKGFAYAIGIVNRERQDAAKVKPGKANNNPETVREHNRAVGAEWLQRQETPTP